MDKRMINGLKTGIDRLDRVITGLFPGDLIVIAKMPYEEINSLSGRIIEGILSQSNRNVAIVSLDRIKNNKTDNTVKSLKCMADALNIPVILLTSISETVTKRKDKSPRLKDLPDDIVDSAQLIMLLNKEEDNDHDEADMMYVTIAKNLNGPIGTVNISETKI